MYTSNKSIYILSEKQIPITYIITTTTTNTTIMIAINQYGLFKHLL